MIKHSRRTAAAALFAAAVLPGFAYGATDWPKRPVTIYVTTAAGGSTDLLARMAADFLSTKFGSSFVVENMPSAGGVQASRTVATADPDGYKILFTPSAAVLLTPLVQKMGFDPDKTLTPVTNVGTGTQVIAVNRSLPVNTLGEFFAYAKANPGKLNFAAAGINNISHLAPLLLFKRAGVDVVMVPSRGEPQAILDLMAGNVNFYFGNASVLLAQKDTPAIKLLAVGTAKRLPNAPDLPSASETVPGFSISSWNGFLVPTGTPDEITVRLRAAIAEMVKTKEMSEKLASLGILPGGQSKEEVTTAFENDRRLFSDAVKVAGIAAP